MGEVMRRLVTMRTSNLTIAVLSACAVACGGTAKSDTTAGGKSAQPPVTTGSVTANSGEAIAAEMLRDIKGDPRIASRDIQVTFKPKSPGVTDDSFELTGTVASDDERVAAEAHVRKRTGMMIGNSLSVVPAPSAQADDMKAGAWTEPAGAARPVIPLCVGLTVVTAIASQGDYESIKTIESISPKGVRLKYSTESSPPWWSPFRAQRNQLITHRTVLTSDLESAHSYDQMFVGTKNAPETAPGTTAIGTSATVLRELKTEGESELSLCKLADDVPVMRDDQLHPVPGGCLNFTDPIPIKRVGTGPVGLRVLLDGTPTELPAIHAQGKSASNERVEFFFLNDERNPLTLAFRLGIGEISALDPETRRLCETDGKKGGIILQGLSCDLPNGGDRDTLRVIKITTRCEAPTATSAGSSEGGAGPVAPGAAAGGANALEAALAEKGTVDIYSIYFSFNSDVLREESEPTLKDIAEVLRRHPDWKLGVNGHTDGIGSDQFNLDLSRRRAAAVKDALLNRYGIGADRLDTAGFGKSQPKDTNETLEGRARNRRVELVRSRS
jgi:outer membrane protein OmpA-like peptidoglycan-associated protein